MKIVADTNILFSAIAGPGLCRELVRQAIENRQLALSDYIVAELRTVLRRKTKWSGTEIEELVGFYVTPAATTIVVPANVPPAACPDPKDLPVLGTAIAAKAEYLVTGDRHLLDLKKYRGVRIVSPREFLQITAGGK